MNKHFVILAAFAGLLMIPATSFAQTFDGGGDGTTWEDPLNWNPDGIPGGNTNVGATTVSLTSNQSIGELDVVGDQTNGTGVLNHSAGTLSTGGWTKVGGNGGPPGPTDGTYNLSGTAATTGSANAFIGFRGGTGTVNLSDSASFTTGELRLAAESAGSTGTINVADNASLLANNINSGGGTGSVATINQTGGTVTSNSWIALSNFGAGGTTTYDISGGTTSANDGNFAIGQEGAGTLNVSGNAVVSQSSAGTDGILVGGFSGQGVDGTGDLNIDGSLASITGSDLRVGDTAGSTGTLSWVADAGGVTEIVSADNTDFGPGTSNLSVDLTALSNFSTFGSGSPIEILLIDNVNAVSGTFTGLAEGAAVDIGDGFATGARISYFGGDGNDVVINVLASAIPEPSSLTLLGLAGFGLMGRRRRHV